MCYTILYNSDISLEQGGNIMDFDFESELKAGVKKEKQEACHGLSRRQPDDSRVATGSNPNLSQLATATAGRKPEKKAKTMKQTVTKYKTSPITSKIQAEARALAESSKGLNIAEFQKKHNIDILNIDQLLRDHGE